MKKYLIALSAFALITGSTMAQSTDNTPKTAPGNQHGREMHHHRQGYSMNGHRPGYMMMKNINLSDGQKQQVKALNEDYRNKVQDLEKDDNITLKAYRTRKAELLKERKDRFQQILTRDQKDKIAANRKKMEEKREIMAQKRMDKMKTDLNLTDAQVSKIQEQRKSDMQQMKAIRENSTLSMEQKKEQMMNLRISSHENMNKILTADQVKKRDELRNSRMKEMKSRWENNAS